MPDFNATDSFFNFIGGNLNLRAGLFHFSKFYNSKNNTIVIENVPLSVEIAFQDDFGGVISFNYGDQNYVYAVIGQSYRQPNKTDDFVYGVSISMISI